MKILVVRHAIAEELNPLSLPRFDDRKRALTDRGRVKMEKASQGLSRLVERIDIIAHSPLVRARQTADILSARFSTARVTEIKELEPGSGLNALGDWLDLVTRGETVALVGHEPDLSSMVGWLCTGRAAGIVRLKKGSAVMMECYRKPGPGCAELQWMLTPKQLRMLAD